MDPDWTFFDEVRSAECDLIGVDYSDRAISRKEKCQIEKVMLFSSQKNRNKYN